MIPLLSRLAHYLGHLSDETLASFLSGELNPLRLVRVSAHLNRCWECRARREELERAAQLVMEFRRGNQSSCLPLDLRHRRSFLANLDSAANATEMATPWPNPFLRLRHSLPAMNSVFVSAVIIAVAGMLLSWIWQRSPKTLSARELLHRAEVSEELHSEQHPAGVLYQQVAVRVGQSTVRHSIYRDLSGQRRARSLDLSVAESQARNSLENVGVDWERPLSAKAFRGWHDQQIKPHDEIVRTGQSELTLTTTLRDGAVAQESLTVRESDFHPIRRVVEMRNQQTIEVAELDYAVLAWPAVNQALFEGLPNVAVSESLTPRSLQAPHSRTTPKPIEVDIAELSARTVLNQLAADTEDQVRITHNDAGVVVKGIVATNERKRELLAQLGTIPLVRSEFLSTEEMTRRVHAELETPSGDPAQNLAGSDALAPLAAYLGKHAQADHLGLSSRQLLDASIKVRSAGVQLLELRERFAQTPNLPDASRAELENLTGLQRKFILDGLQAEANALVAVGLNDAENQNGAAPANSTILAQSIASNQQYCQELISSPDREPRPAMAIVADIYASIRAVRNSVGQPSKPFPQP